MGKMFSQQFQKIGKKVLVSDKNSIADEKKLVRESDVVIISVPMGNTPTVIRRIKPWLHKDQIISDFTSVKNKVIPAMLETEASVISCHPMFGNMEEISGQNIILLPVREGRLLAKYKRLYKELGLNIVVMKEWKKHDQSMSFIQGLMHFIHIIFTQTLFSRDVDLDTLLSICSPVYQANFAFACRILQRDPHLYTHILMDNPENVGVLNSFIEQAKLSLKLIQKKDEVSFKKNFLTYRDFLNYHAEEFSSQSDYLIEKLKEYSCPEKDSD